MDGELPWPVILTLAGFSKKHIFLSSKMPQVADVLRSVKMCIDKIKWSYTFLGEESNELLKAIRQRRRTPHCSKVVPAEITGFTSYLY